MFSYLQIYNVTRAYMYVQCISFKPEKWISLVKCTIIHVYTCIPCQLSVAMNQVLKALVNIVFS